MNCGVMGCHRLHIFRVVVVLSRKLAPLRLTFDRFVADLISTSRLAQGACLKILSQDEIHVISRANAAP